jgi:hypothetical protein
VRSIIIEFHPELGDYSQLIANLERAGFTYLPSDSVFPDSMDAFVKRDLAAAS